MSHFNDYMEGVPVKISEKYIRPRRIELPYSVHECARQAQHSLENVEYCFTFEENVLSKLKELRRVKETKKNERKHRLQLLEEAKQKKLDAIAAAEAEEKLKQLSVSEVSYPSTDEISEISSDDKTDKYCDVTLIQEDTKEIQTEPLAQPEISYTACNSQPEPQLNILQPIPVQNPQPNNLLDDPDPLQELKLQNKAVQIPQYNPAFSKRNVDTLTYKDFENDTSSPFDNAELNTINDMELLAQVLQSQKDSSTSCHPQQNYMPDQGYTQLPSCAHQVQTEALTYIPNAYEQMQGPSIAYSPQHYSIANGYYIPTDNCDNNMPVDIYLPNYQQYLPAYPYPVNPNYCTPQVIPDLGDMNQLSNNSTYIPQPYYYNYPPIPFQYQQPTYVAEPPQNMNTPEAVEKNDTTIAQQGTKSRSRSVPDIVRELNEELALAKQRANERSFNASPLPKDVPKPTTSNKKGEKKHRKKSEQLPNPYDKLSDNLKSMCRKIHGMGFPLDRVARVFMLLGDNDKKVIETLLIIGELMDLGFTEARVTEALVKHEFNRDNALDELIS